MCTVISPVGIELAELRRDKPRLLPNVTRRLLLALGGGMGAALGVLPLMPSQVVVRGRAPKDEYLGGAHLLQDPPAGHKATYQCWRCLISVLGAFLRSFSPP